MTEAEFAEAFRALTGNPPFPWQAALFKRFAAGDFPDSCNLPTGLGKTSVVAIWLLALAAHPDKLPRRLVYVVNRRTVVDQTTTEVENIRKRLFDEPNLYERLCELPALPPVVPYRWEPLSISTLRGQFADNREWSADPARPAVVVGTVDMIGSRLLFSGYGVGFKGKPLHAGFLGQDVLLVHDEAHLEPAFQDLLVAIRKEQERCKEFGTFRVMELSATSRGGGKVFELTADDRANETVQKRVGAKKAVHLHENKDEKKLADELADLALRHKDSGRAVLVFARTVDAVDKIADKLRKAKQKVETLTGTMRGLERDGLVEKPTFRRFLPKAEDIDETVYLVCTSAGEVGVNISADHLVCDLSTFDSMAQRFGRVNRFGLRDDTQIDILHPTKFGDDPYDHRREKTLALLRELNGDGSPAALGQLDAARRVEAFSPSPTVLPVSDILFDAWALTTVRGKLPGRPMVEPYLHGISGYELPETHVAWRDEVERITDGLLEEYKPKDLLEDYPLKPHELLRDNSARVFDRLKKLKADPGKLVWVVADDETVTVTTLGELIEAGKEGIERVTLLLPPSAGGLADGMLTAGSEEANDVADEWRDDQGKPRRRRDVWDDDEPPPGMRWVRTIDTDPDRDEDAEQTGGKRYWHWYESIKDGDSDGSRGNKHPVTLDVHTRDVIKNVERIVAALPLSGEMRAAVIKAAEWHDLGKKRPVFQKVLGNWKGDPLMAKSGQKAGRHGLREDYRHEFGSMVDVLNIEKHHVEFQKLSADMQELVLHLIATHHGRGRPHFPPDEATHPANGPNADRIAREVPRRFARLQRKYGRWGLAYLESMLRAADYAASADPSEFYKGGES
jgi:CRISPR-associated endonuclease/helicase Cas3